MEIAGLDGLPERPRRHLEDLFRLATLLEGRWPQELSKMQSVLSADANDALHTICVYRSEGIPRLTRWQTELVEKLNQDADHSEERLDEELPQILNEVLGSDFAGEPGSTLRFLQEWLFEAVTDKGEIDGSVQWTRSPGLPARSRSRGRYGADHAERESRPRTRRHRPADTR